MFDQEILPTISNLRTVYLEQLGRNSDEEKYVYSDSAGLWSFNNDISRNFFIFKSFNFLC